MEVSRFDLQLNNIIDIASGQIYMFIAINIYRLKARFEVSTLIGKRRV
jgi:hypothetical protein